MRWWTRSRTRLVAADPGLRRLRSAARVVLGVIVALGLAVPVVSALGQPFTSVVLAAVAAATATLQQPYDRVEPAPDDGDEEGDGRRLRPTTRMALVVSLTAR